jgi:hypothetical protein
MGSIPTAVHGWAGRNNWSLEIHVTITSFSTAECLLVNPECSRVRRALQADRYKVQAETRVSVAAKRKPTSFTTILLRVILGRPMFMTAETPTRIPAFYSPEP